MNVLISGGAGFIGSHICELFLEDGHTVYAIDNLSTGKWDNISVTNDNHKNLKKIKINVEHMDKLYFTGVDIIHFDIVMHLASPASPTAFAKNPIDILNANLTGTRNMLDLARRHDAKFVFASTSEVYGNPPESELPLKESYNGNVNSLGVRGCYDEGKRGGEAYCKAYEREYGLDTRIIRIFNTYGERMPDDGRAIPTFIRQALSRQPLTIFGSGQQTRAFLYIDDLIKGIMAYTLYRYRVVSPINLGATKETPILNIAQLIQKLSGIDGHVVEFYAKTEDDPERRLPDITRAKLLLGWEPTTSLDVGLKHTIDWFRLRWV